MYSKSCLVPLTILLQFSYAQRYSRFMWKRLFFISLILKKK